MNQSISIEQQRDPEAPNWAEMELPNTWIDQFDFRRPQDWYRVIRSTLAKQRKPVALPESLPGYDWIPKYVRQEFHSLPNGNYSKRFTRGYITGFETSMLGVMAKARQRMAHHLRHCHSALDVGCAGGRTAGALRKQGIPDVWGLDPSPYLLQHAAKDNPDVRFVQGLAEQTGFPAARFDGVAACFLFHEIPPRYAEQALNELARVLKPGGLLVICEPSEVQLRSSIGNLWRRFGWRGVYFGWVAKRMFEPFLDAWHNTASADFFQQRGFDILEDEMGMPLRHIVLRKNRR